MRGFVTLSFGNAEVWEIGDWCWTWSQICCEKKLEKNTDYVFRFSLEGGVCDTNVTVTIEGIDDMLDIGKKVNNVNIAFENVTIPQKVLDLIHLKMGDDCNLATSSCTAG